jgi:hypothetical protein
MIDRLQLAAALQRVSQHLFPDVDDVIERALALYHTLSKDETFAERARNAESSFLIPSWTGNLADVHTHRESGAYDVLAVDGSQIYPDRHMSGAGCFLINSGGVHLSYGSEGRVDFFSTPEVYMTSQLFGEGESIGGGVESIDLLREARELETTVAKVQELHAKQVSPVVLFDGTIIFWMLEGKAPGVKTTFLKRYLDSLSWLEQNKVLNAGYISMPKSKEIVNLIKLGLCRFSVANCIPCHAVHKEFPCKVVDALVDTHIMGRLLEKGQRSTVFASHSSIVAEYPARLRPHFFYLHVGDEVGRVEIPAWIACDEALIDQLCGILLDQAEKGGGYPVSLAEAHEQAVVKGPDREFFYQLITQIGLEQNRRITTSQKSMKKRGMRV